MHKCRFWKKNGTDALPVYDFRPPQTWGDEKIEAARQMIAAKIESAIFEPMECVYEGWLELILLMPINLRNIILFEISMGNFIVSIGKTGWPNPESIVVTLKDRFHAASREPTGPARWRLLNDPHYCREEISEPVCQTEYLIIC